MTTSPTMGGLFADDGLIYRAISGDNDADLLQTDLDRLNRMGKYLANEVQSG